MVTELRSLNKEGGAYIAPPSSLVGIYLNKNKNANILNNMVHDLRQGWG